MITPLKPTLLPLIFIILISITACDPAHEELAETDYGVFLSVTDDLGRLEDYDIIVIDAQFFTEDEIRDFRDSGHRVYSYINIGSIEDWRDYYDDYKDLALSEYEHWEEEYWINTADSRWQNFVIDDLIPSLTAKGIDGFFVDNCDVYYHYPTQEIMDGLTAMMKSMINTGKAVLINGGDSYLGSYCDNGGRWDDVITGINQETVFSKILWDGDRFGTASEEDNDFFRNYIERFGAQGADIYLLEYTRDTELIEKIAEYCRYMGFKYYVSDSIELD